MWKKFPDILPDLDTKFADHNITYIINNNKILYENCDLFQMNVVEFLVYTIITI